MCAAEDKIQSMIDKLSMIEKQGAYERCLELYENEKQAFVLSNIVQHFIKNYLKHEVSEAEMLFILQAGLVKSTEQNLPHYLKMSVVISSKTQKYFATGVFND